MNQLIKNTKFFLKEFFGKSLGIKLFLYFSFFLFCISLIFTIYYISHQKSYLRKSIYDKGKLLVSILAYNSRIGAFTENVDFLSTPVRSVLQNDDVVEVSVYNSNWTVLIRSSKYNIESKENIFKKELNNGVLVLNSRSKNIPIFYYEEDEVIDFWSIIYSNYNVYTDDLIINKLKNIKKRRIIGFVKVTLDKSLLGDQLMGIYFNSLLIMFSFFIIFGLISFLLVKSSLKPLNFLAEKVFLLGDKGIFKKVEINSNDEIGKLAEAFNKMAESLKNREEIIKESEKKYRTLFTSMNLGLAYFRIIKNLYGKTIDFKVLEINDAFNKITDLAPDQINGKNISELISTYNFSNEKEIYKILFDATTNKKINMEIYCKLFKKWLYISFFSPIDDHFVLILEDIDYRKKWSNSLKNLIKKKKFYLVKYIIE